LIVSVPGFPPGRATPRPTSAPSQTYEVCGLALNGGKDGAQGRNRTTDTAIFSLAPLVN